jgi:cytochrome b involved in lipid metabolism
VIIFEGIVYEVTDYIGQHPGGSDLIENYLGKSIDEPFEEAEHTKAARQIFRDLNRIGYV